VRKAITATALAAGLIPLAACGTDKPVTGTVVAKDHDPAKRTCAKHRGTGAKRKCVRWRTSGEEWELTVRTADGDEVEVDVARDVYDRYTEGDRYPKGG
jgi:hypothetical protein